MKCASVHVSLCSEPSIHYISCETEITGLFSSPLMYSEIYYKCRLRRKSDIPAIKFGRPIMPEDYMVWATFMHNI